MQARVKSVFGADRVVVHPRPMYAVAEGATIVAAGLTDHTSSNEQLFLEILEIFDPLESLIDYLQNHPQLTQKAIERIPKSLNTIQSKLVATLARRQVERIEITDPSDLQFCQIVDTQIDPAVAAPIISKVVRQGFTIEERLLRPVEVIVHKPPVG